MTYEVLIGTEGGQKVAVVPLSNSKRTVRLLVSDFDLLEQMGVGLPWKFMAGLVWVRNGKQNLVVARLILDADVNQVVRYLDDNQTNLMRSNLVRVPGYSKFKARDRIKPVMKWNPPQITYKQAPGRTGLEAV